MTPQNTSSQVQTKRQISMANFLNLPNTSKFLEETLQNKKTEFVSNLITLCDQDEKLAKCDPAALMRCAMNATAVNLPLNRNLGYAFVIPYKKGDVYEPNFQIGYKGIIQLAIRTGKYRYLNAVEIREGEIDRNKITGELKFLGEKPQNKVVGYIAYLELMSGFSASLYMTEEKIEEHASRYSQMYQADKRYKTAKSKWSIPDERPKMALKTVLKGLLGTYGLLTTELVKAFELDNEEGEHNTGARVEEASAEIMQQDEPAPKAEPARPQKIQI